MRLPAAGLVAALALVAAGCGGGDDGLTVFAAASLTDVFVRVDGEARFNFAGSDELATQLREGARADVYAAANVAYPAQLHAEGLLDRPRVFATNELVLIVPRDNPGRIRVVADLARDGVKLVVGAQGVPIGDYTREVLAKLGRQRVLARVVSEEQDVKGVVSKVAEGEADAGFVYRTDVRPAAGDVRLIALPARARARVEYAAAVASDTRRRDEAEDFLEALLDRNGRRELRRAGFGVP